MESQPLPGADSSSSTNTGVRRHHTISASSRAARGSAKESISEETQEQQLWNDDEPVDQDWVGGVGAVGEKTSLHRQSSLPTSYHRGFHGGRGSKSGNLTPKTVNSLAAIAGHEGDEEVWDIGGFSVDDEHAVEESSQHDQAIDNQAINPPLSPHFVGSEIPSPPPAGSGVRRHVSLTYGAAVGGARKGGAGGLQRAGTLQGPGRSHQHIPSPPETAEGPEDDEYAYDGHEEQPYEEEYVPQQYQGNVVDRASPWTQNNEWRTTGGSGFSSGGGNGGSIALDDVQRALSALEIANPSQTQSYQNYPGTGQSSHPPRFKPNHPPPAQAPGTWAGGNGQGNGFSGRKMQSMSESDGRTTPGSSYPRPPSGAGYSHSQYQSQPQRDERSGSWDQRERSLGNRLSNPNMQHGYQQGQHSKNGSSGNNVPNVPPIPQQYQQPTPRLGVNTAFNPAASQQQPSVGQGNAQAYAGTPIDVPSLIATKGYNPTNFDTRPSFARFFVIKSYTEDDVHKSLKYEIWSSTDPGNKRLDKAFKETSGRGPIYLFFSVNASGHFCGMAEMLTPVDYTRSSTVWASDKWKGVFKVRWIFVRDIPNVNLRHIKLNNTQERKPVTNSRDTQELLPEAGQEMLRIFHTHPARTSLLQDFAFYELQAMQKLQTPQGQGSPTQSPNPSVHSPQLSSASLSPQIQQQTPFGLPLNPNAVGYQMPQMSPMMQMQMQMNMGMGLGMGSQFNVPTQSMHQSVMRHPSPGPSQVGAGQTFMGF